MRSRVQTVIRNRRSAEKKARQVSNTHIDTHTRSLSRSRSLYRTLFGVHAIISAWCLGQSLFICFWFATNFLFRSFLHLFLHLSLLLSRSACNDTARAYAAYTQYWSSSLLAPRMLFGTRLMIRYLCEVFVQIWLTICIQLSRKSR